MRNVSFLTGNINDWTEEDLKALARTRRREAMDMVMRMYGNRLHIHATGILHDPQEAYDVVQDVFIKAMREQRLFDDDFKIAAWLFRVTRNLCFNLSRDRRRREHLLTTTPVLRAEAPPDVAKLVVESESQDEMLEAIGQLTEDHRQILLLRYYEDKSYTEIADVLCIKLGTVMSRLSRARTRLQEVLENDAPMLLAS